MRTVDTSELFAKYPHIAKKITTLWGSAECHELLMALISDSRDGVRAGFSHEIAHTIFSLLNRHDSLYPQFDKSATVATFGFPDTSRPVRKPVKSSGGDWRIFKYLIMFLAVIIVIGLLKAYKIAL